VQCLQVPRAYANLHPGVLKSGVDMNNGWSRVAEDHDGGCGEGRGLFYPLGVKPVDSDKMNFHFKIVRFGAF